MDAKSRWGINATYLSRKMQNRKEEKNGVEGLGSMLSGRNVQSESKLAEPRVDDLAVEIQFSSERHKEAFKTLTDRQKQYIAAYMRLDSRAEIARELGLSGSANQVSKRLAEISRLMGCSDVRELRGGKPLGNDGQRATAAELKSIVEKQGYRCALTGRSLTPKNSELDHVVPRSKGGSNEACNLQWLHRQVNRAKGTMPQSDFIAMCQEVSDWTRRQQKSGSLPGSNN
jgi:hypothetical protein